MSLPDPSFVDSRPELVFALVGGAGTRLSNVSDLLIRELKTFGYKAENIRLSDLLDNFKERTKQTGTSEFDRIRYRQMMGNAFRRKFNKGDALARAGIAEIRMKRNSISNNSDLPAPAQAYILNQLKHPEEVNLLRQVYGSSFLLVAGHAPLRERIDALAHEMARKAHKPGKDANFYGDASEVIRIDEKEDDDFGQNVRDTYPKADFFVNLKSPSLEFEVKRFMELLFGHPFHTPRPDEYAMYHANAVSLRSSDDNRQVGAVIFSIDDPLNLNNLRKADVIAVGMNEVPRGGGGLYWEQASPDARDQFLLFDKKEDRAAEIKISVLTELIDKIIQKKWLQSDMAGISASDLATSLLKELKGTQFLDIGEFSRPVHAEMAALIDAARRGVAVDGHSMYVTTFPCHNCAKHIIAAGIRRVVYLEPYPKSRAINLYGEEINPESLLGELENGKLVFYAFTGIAPRQYEQLFSMHMRGAKKGKSLTKWHADRHLLFPLYVPHKAALLYLEHEREVMTTLTPDIYSKSGS